MWPAGPTHQEVEVPVLEQVALQGGCSGSTPFACGHTRRSSGQAMRHHTGTTTQATPKTHQLVGHVPRSHWPVAVLHTWPA